MEARAAHKRVLGARCTQIYVWSVRTGRLLDVLAGHEGPVSQLAFSPGGGPATLLASASWDKTVRCVCVCGVGEV